MKIKFILFLLIPFASFAQTNSYEIDPISIDSFYLVEKVIGTATKEIPRPQTLITYQLFRSAEEFFLFSDQFIEQATTARKEAEEKIKQAEKLEELADKMRIVAEENKSFLGRRKKQKK
jgi:hypothetical protein